MLPTLSAMHHGRKTLPSARMSPRTARHAAVSRAKAARHPHSRLCPICNQWRTFRQYPQDARACGACMPTTDPNPSGPRHVSAKAVLEDLDWLLDARTAPAEIPGRLHFPTAQALERWLYRQGRADLVARLGSRATA